MSRSASHPLVFSLLALLVALLAGTTALADSKPPAKEKDALKDSGVVGGLVIDKQNDSITVQIDGRDEPTKFVIGQGLNRTSLDALKSIFSVDRVNVRYKTDGDQRRVLAVEKVPGQANGVIIGEVVKVYNNFWVAVKPKNGMIEGFALNGPAEKVKDVANMLKSLKPGDQVAIKYATDFERHRILKMEVRPVPAPK